MALSDVTEAPDATLPFFFNGKNFGVTLQNSPIFQLQQVAALLIGRANFLDASNKSLRFCKVATGTLPHLARHAALHYLTRQLPHIDILLVKMGDLRFLVGDQ